MVVSVQSPLSDLTESENLVLSVQSPPSDLSESGTIVVSVQSPLSDLTESETLVVSEAIWPILLGSNILEISSVQICFVSLSVVSYSAAWKLTLSCAIRPAYGVDTFNQSEISRVYRLLDLPHPLLPSTSSSSSALLVSVGDHVPPQIPIFDGGQYI
ncbi:hypothetical protein PoB_003743900 [Plakobranchus ocellatus]|uniref:Uncharacterized protein n=1 Tax=Plakobranchus ocellatus TaxID=259542 RepID=A0AAV4AXR7_9GAST|nr:hypothetical protein PoB_003743900 [Plakobranchus ocellatus]